MWPYYKGRIGVLSARSYTNPPFTGHQSDQPTWWTSAVFRINLSYSKSGLLKVKGVDLFHGQRQQGNVTWAHCEKFGEQTTTGSG